MNQELFEKLKKDFPEIKRNEQLKKHTSMKVGGPARYFYVAKSSSDLEKILKVAIKEHLPYAVIGNGTNVIFADAGFSGLIIKNESSNLIFEKDEAIADSGISLQRLLRRLAEANMGGLEFLAGIPGSLGGAVFGNAGAYGRSMEDVTRGVLILDIDGQVIQISKKDMQFKYRSSYLKELAKTHDQGKLPVILSVRLAVNPKVKEAVLRVIGNYIKIRSKKYPHKPSAGSFFKNVIIKDNPGITKQAKMAAIEGKIPAGFLIEKAGCKGLQIGGAQVSQEHANFIVNTGRAKASDIKKLARVVKEKVKESFGIEMEEEVEYIGDFSLAPKGIFSRIFNKDS